ncbi:hypothetical protein HF086_009879 [Spodoptera exigua]|uniref:Uncharacterized protein n=1 Tax=Spodoptera exigua TaxID=7107 RepID=A0A922M4R2_SPOEX|nr:hypothetical protein HF086_009879 [Spodoptera exigua]
MILKVLILLLVFVSFVASDSCVTYNFEKDFDDLFNNYAGLCYTGNHLSWITEQYSNFDLTGPNKLSTKFITPTPGNTMSCTTSFSFTMNAGGTIELEMYADSETNHNIQIMVFEEASDGVVGMANPAPAKGWRTVRIENLGGKYTFEGFVSIMAMASTDHIILIDSIRYLPPEMNPDLCKIYEEITSTTPTTTTPTTTTPTTTTPTTTTPTTTTPTTTTPTTTTPTTTTPTTTTPTTTTPTTTTPTTTTPTTTTPTTTTPTTTTPTTTIPTTTTPTNTIPTTTTPTTTTTSITTTTSANPDNTENTNSFWSPLIITMVVLLYLIVFVLICLLFYKLGKRKRKALDAKMNDIEDVPSTFKVPRVKSVYLDINSNPYTRNDLPTP